MDTNPALTQQASRGREDPVVTGLVTRARNGELRCPRFSGQGIQ